MPDGAGHEPASPAPRSPPLSPPTTAVASWVLLLVLASVGPPEEPLEEPPDELEDGLGALAGAASLAVAAAPSSAPRLAPLPWSNGMPEFVDVAHAATSEAPSVAPPRAQTGRLVSQRWFIGNTSARRSGRSAAASHGFRPLGLGIHARSGSFRGHGSSGSAQTAARGQGDGY